jgi:hypothetical protein
MAIVVGVVLGSKSKCDVHEKRGRFEWRFINPGYLVSLAMVEPCSSAYICEAHDSQIYWSTANPG